MDILLFFILLSVVLLVLLGIATYYNYIYRKRNSHLMKVVSRADAYRRAAIISDDKTAHAPDGEDPNPNLEANPHHASTAENAADEDERLFILLDKKLSADYLFLQPGIGRDDLCALINVDKNRMGRIITRYSSASNASVYINIKRVEYAAQLMMEHPEYTISSIAEECGMTNTVTFNRIFKEVYGVPPSIYRDKMEERKRPGGG